MSGQAVRWTRRAVRRLDQIGAHIARDNPAAAARTVARLVAEADALAARPAMGRPGRLRGTRELVIPALPYIVAYRITSDSVDVLTIMHIAQQWPDAL